ncbi:hypothetical protein [Micromonospora sp. NBC_00421]
MGERELTYGGGGIDRAAALRADPQWLAAQLAAPGSRGLPAG